MSYGSSKSFGSVSESSASHSSSSASDSVSVSFSDSISNSFSSSVSDSGSSGSSSSSMGDFCSFDWSSSEYLYDSPSYPGGYLQITFVNTGTIPIEIESVSSPDADVVPIGWPTPAIVPPGGSLVFEIGALAETFPTNWSFSVQTTCGDFGV